jgi:hypothetical protein
VCHTHSVYLHPDDKALEPVLSAFIRPGIVSPVALARLASIFSHLRRKAPSIQDVAKSISKASTAWRVEHTAGGGRQNAQMSSPPDNKGYLSSLSSYSPWASKSVMTKPSQPKDNGAKSMETGHGAQRGGDHTVSNRHRLSLRSYPHDCPPLNVQWYHAVDVQFHLETVHVEL